MSSSSGGAIINTYINPNSSVNSNYSLALKISGKGLYNLSNINNDYDYNGIGFQLLSNVNSNINKEFSINDTSNISNLNYSSLRIGINSSLLSIRNISQPILFNDFLHITSSSKSGLGIGNNSLNLNINKINIHSSSNNTSIHITNSTIVSGLLISKLDNNAIINNTNSQPLVFHSSGFIGIGTTNPLSNFHIHNGNMIIRNRNLGIGTTNPSSNLDVVGNVLISSNINLNNLILSGVYYNPDGSTFISSQWSNVIGQTNNIFYNLGSVGIGTTTPKYQLDVSSGTIKCFNMNIEGNNIDSNILFLSGKNASLFNKTSFSLS